MKHISLVLATTLLTSTILMTGCFGDRATVVVAESGSIAQSLGQLLTATKQLTDATALPAAVALNVQQQLQAVNDRLRPLPEMLRTIERLRAAGDSSATQTDQALAIIEGVGHDLSTVIADVPISDTTQQLVALVQAAQKTVQATLIELAKLKGAQ